MRTNRSGYSSSPAGSSRALDQKPRPRRSKREWNQLMLMIFFIILPVIGLFAIFFQPFRWIFMVCVVVSLALMWMIHAFLFPGRMILTAVYGLMLVFTLVTALDASSSTSRRNQNTFIVTTPIPITTPQFGYGTMGTSVPAGYYDDGSHALLDAQEVGFSGGSEDESGMDLGLTEGGANSYVPVVKSDSEIALENFMERWHKGIIAEMLLYTPKSWRDAEGDAAQQQLFWKFKQKPLSDWRQMSAPTGTEASTARTITVEADIEYGGDIRTYQYDAVILCEDGVWYVDPNSLSTGVLVTPATPTPDPNATPVPTPEPTPTPTPGPKTKLYYNRDGGKRYHADPQCYTVDKKYLPLASFNYGDLSKSPYNRLEPCEKCNAPARK